jgi:hypothetical protein
VASGEMVGPSKTNSEIIYFEEVIHWMNWCALVSIRGFDEMDASKKARLG